MTRTEAISEGAKHKAELLKNSRQMRAATTQRLLVMGTGEIDAGYGPLYKIESVQRKGTVEGGHAVDCTLYWAVFEGEETVKLTRREAQKWIASKKAQWQREQGKKFWRKKAKCRIRNVTRRIGDILNELGDHLEGDTLRLLIDASNATELACQTITEQGDLLSLDQEKKVEASDG